MLWGWNIIYTMNEFKWVAIMFGVLFVAMALTSFAPSEKERVKQHRWDNCVDSVNQAIPDPNATEERAEFLKTCYE
jgi:hypothetical protein